ncbi:DUF3955 domain-containing protein [Photobacterium angustum]|uniref:DUF3955 domain-containing protein n=1 Tax=Photobacterium angustum TaxID=661 RepID=UPI0005E1906C|nr:DUF3955 domain-containing protein [Photobacterium angustum]KJG17939.1 hypothetical protein UA33_08280 [Photobacterium angustum]KJG24598.1 hypothetical protein UA39_07840 [Photobacterium angustum]KJG32715.1 hypothetical protein UA36_04505 [Photobacterium angustum]PSW97326.1 DUF3955 domain-containing protein [Photobacterium angustum]PSW99943.1 DUF3955 domain-containing protein [Photobacterium angustum]
MTLISRYRVTFLLSLIGWGCLAIYAYKGSYVDDNGVLIESFGFIPLFWLFQLLALASLIYTVLKHRKTR